MVLHEQVVIVEAAQRHEKHLAAHVERAARADEPRHDLELVGERVAGGEHGGRLHRRQRAVDHALHLDGASRDDGVFILEHVVAGARDQCIHRVPELRKLVCAGSSARILIAPFGLVWYCSASRPATNTALPLAEMQVSSEFGDCCCWTAQCRPAARPSRWSRPRCHWPARWTAGRCARTASAAADWRPCWCSGTAPAWSAGSADPTLSCTASLPASHRPLSPASCGASAYCRLSVSTWPPLGVSAVGASARARQRNARLRPRRPRRRESGDTARS